MSIIYTYTPTLKTKKTKYTLEKKPHPQSPAPYAAYWFELT
jgi:hypothetical protein